MFEKLGFSSHERRAIYLLLILILGGVFYRVIVHNKFSNGVNLWVQAENTSEVYKKPKFTVSITPDTPLNINTANEEQLVLLPGIGTITAKRIIEHRNSIGQFSNIDQLDDVPGIGVKKILKLKYLICVLDSSVGKTTSKQ
jgi:competence ComEA-like helix-hairpin-helix protein